MHWFITWSCGFLLGCGATRAWMRYWTLGRSRLLNFLVVRKDWVSVAELLEAGATNPLIGPLWVIQLIDADLIEERRVPGLIPREGLQYRVSSRLGFR